MLKMRNTLETSENRSEQPSCQLSGLVSSKIRLVNYLRKKDVEAVLVAHEYEGQSQSTRGNRKEQ